MSMKSSMMYGWVSAVLVFSLSCDAPVYEDVGAAGDVAMAVCDAVLVSDWNVFAPSWPVNYCVIAPVRDIARTLDLDGYFEPRAGDSAMELMKPVEAELRAIWAGHGVAVDLELLARQSGARFLSLDEDRQLLDSGVFYEEFYSRYPAADGIRRFSQVGLDRNHERAAVWYEEEYGWHCSASFLVGLQLIDGEWRITSYDRIGGS